MSVAVPSRGSVVPRPASGFRPKASTLVASPAPPSAGSKIPPQRAPIPSTLDLADADIVEAKPVARPSTPPPMPKKSMTMSAVKAPSVPPRPSSIPPKRGALDVVREAIGELEYFATHWQAAGVCAAALARGLGARAVIIHTHDPRRTEIRVVAANGPQADVLLGASALVEDDFVGSTVIANRKPMSMFIDGELPRIAPDRLRAMGAAKSLVAAPAIERGEVVAMIEVVDATEAAPIVERAVAHAASQLGAFLVQQKKSA